MKSRITVIMLVILFVWCHPSTATRIGLTRHTVDRKERLRDRRPPAIPEVTLNGISRGQARSLSDDGPLHTRIERENGCIEIQILSSLDDRTPFESMGYEIHLLGGTLPNDCSIPDGAYQGHQNRMGTFSWISWIDGATDVQEPFDFTVAVVAVDLGGNKSKQSRPLRIAHEGSANLTPESVADRISPLPIEISFVVGDWRMESYRIWLHHGELLDYRLLGEYTTQWTFDESTLRLIEKRFSSEERFSGALYVEYWETHDCWVLMDPRDGLRLIGEPEVHEWGVSFAIPYDVKLGHRLAFLRNGDNEFELRRERLLPLGWWLPYQRNKYRRISPGSPFVPVVAPTLIGRACSKDSSAVRDQEELQNPLLPDANVWVEENIEPPCALDGGTLDKPPHIVHFERPKYPDLPRAAGISGVVCIEIVVGKSGDVEEARVVSSTASPVMDTSALEAARKSEYRPGMRDGKPVACRLVHGIHFEVDAESIPR